jgi:hypothetical protein
MDIANDIMLGSDSFYAQIQIAIEVGPIFEKKPLCYKPSFESCFSKGVQNTLLLRLEHTLSGHILIELMKNFRAEVAQLEWTDQEQALKDLMHMKDNRREA